MSAFLPDRFLTAAVDTGLLAVRVSFNIDGARGANSEMFSLSALDLLLENGKADTVNSLFEQSSILLSTGRRTSSSNLLSSLDGRYSSDCSRRWSYIDSSIALKSGMSSLS